MQIYKIKPLFQKFLESDKKLFIKLGIGPTAINLLALLVSILGGLAIYLSSFNLLFLIAVPFLAYIRIAFNALDGMVAREIRAKNQRFGEVLNEFIDRLSDSAFFFGLAFASYIHSGLALSALSCVLIVSYLGIVGKAAGGSRQYVALMGKADRMFWLSVSSVAAVVFSSSDIMSLFLWFVIILSIVTMFQRFFAIKKELYRPVKK